jgi:hypothetical protein
MVNQYPDWIEEQLKQMKGQGGVRVLSDGQYTYVLLALGERPTGGYDISVLEASEQIVDGQRTVVVRAKEVKPAPDMMVIQVLTYPVAVYRLPRTDLPVKVEWVRR